MSEITLNIEPDLSLEELKEKFESITREYSLAVIEGSEEGREYPDAPDNIRFLNDLIFETVWAIGEREAHKPKTVPAND